MGEARVGGWYCNAVASENSVTKWQRSWAIDRIRVTIHTGAKTKTILGADGKLYKRKNGSPEGFDEKCCSFLKGSIGFCFKHIKWRQREKNNVPVALVVLSFHLDRKDRKVLSLRQRDSPDSRRGPALFFSSPLSSLKKNSCWRF